MDTTLLLVRVVQRCREEKNKEYLLQRAILKDAPIIILDEATSSVDPENEHMLISAIKELTKIKHLLVLHIDYLQ